MSEDQISGRLSKIQGQVEGIRRMRVDGRPCTEILDQITAARAALAATAILVLEEHLRAGVGGASSRAPSGDGEREVLDVVRRIVRSS